MRTWSCFMDIKQLHAPNNILQRVVLWFKLQPVKSCPLKPKARSRSTDVSYMYDHWADTTVWSGAVVWNIKQVTHAGAFCLRVTVYTSLYIHAPTQVSVYTLLYIHAPTQESIYTLVYIHAPTQVSIYTSLYTHAPTQVSIYTSLYIHAPTQVSIFQFIFILNIEDIYIWFDNKLFPFVWYNFKYNVALACANFGETRACHVQMRYIVLYPSRAKA